MRTAACVGLALLQLRAVTRGEEHYDYVEHDYGAAGVPTHGGDHSYDGHQYAYQSSYGDHGVHGDGSTTQYGYHEHDYGAGVPSNYMTHGSLVLDSMDAFNEFMAMDLLETAVVAVFPDGEDLESGSHDEFEAYKEVAAEFSHLFRFAHSTAPEVIDELHLGLEATGPHKSAVMVAPAPLLAANHPRAGAWLRFPGARVKREPLQVFLFMESAPLVGQYDWRSTERASAAGLPCVTVFARINGELRHTYHDRDAESEAVGGDAPASHADFFSFDVLSSALRPVGLARRHDINLLVADMVTHAYDMHSYGLQGALTSGFLENALSQKRPARNMQHSTP